MNIRSFAVVTFITITLTPAQAGPFGSVAHSPDVKSGEYATVHLVGGRRYMRRRPSHRVKRRRVRIPNRVIRCRIPLATGTVNPTNGSYVVRDWNDHSCPNDSYMRPHRHGYEFPRHMRRVAPDRYGYMPRGYYRRPPQAYRGYRPPRHVRHGYRPHGQVIQQVRPQGPTTQVRPSGPLPWWYQ